MAAYALEMRGITKEFPGVRALDGVTFRVRWGEIHALCGENGAGKSTLMKVLSGFYPAGTFTGELLVDGQPQRFAGIRDAEAAGIAIIYQELALVKELSVAENIFLGHEPGRLGVVDTDRMYAESRRWLQRVGLDIDPSTPVGRLGVGQQQLVEIAKALSRQARILILDEPTAALADAEVKVLQGILRQLRQEGVACIYISHKLDEVFALADTITVLRDGRTVGTYPAAELTEDAVIRLMVGRELNERYPRTRQRPGDPVLEVRGLTAYGRDGTPVVKDVSFTLHAGEVLGVAGLMGAGRTEMATALFGAWPGRVEGEVRLAGRRLPLGDPGAALKAGLAMVTEDRKRYGLVHGMDIKGNITLAALGQVSPGGVLDEPAEIRESRRWAEALKVKAASLEVPVRTLSGGNQQKVLLARMLMCQPRVLILDEPTRGIDVGAKFEIYRVMDEWVRQGGAILLISSEMPEVIGLADRILVMSGGRVVAELDAQTATQEQILYAATGGR